MAVTIKDVYRNSYAYRAGCEAGDTLLSINGNEIVDVLDYRFYQLNSDLELKIRDRKGQVHTVKVRKPEYEELGLEFDTYLMDKEKSCRNKCIFCFIDQLPKGMRESLYFKDDDSRLSFLFGNYVTLTNLTEHEISRIIKMHISPINVSVHTTNPELRVKMMNNRFAGDALKILKRLSEHNIAINTQIVCCPGWNDGEELKRSLRDLYELNVNLIGVVPVGITKYREGLAELTPFTVEKARETVDILEEFGEMCMETRGKRIAYAADELYIKAGYDIPDASFYGDFEAIENGIGLIAQLRAADWLKFDMGVVYVTIAFSIFPVIVVPESVLIVEENASAHLAHLESAAEEGGFTHQAAAVFRKDQFVDAFVHMLRPDVPQIVHLQLLERTHEALDGVAEAPLSRFFLIAIQESERALDKHRRAVLQREFLEGGAAGGRGNRQHIPATEAVCSRIFADENLALVFVQAPELGVGKIPRQFLYLQIIFVQQETGQTIVGSDEKPVLIFQRHTDLPKMILRKGKKLVTILENYCNAFVKRTPDIATVVFHQCQYGIVQKSVIGTEMPQDGTILSEGIHPS